MSFIGEPTSALNHDINFCPKCGGILVRKTIAGYPRLICKACGRIHYINPKVVVGIIPVTDGRRVILIQRDIEPGQGCWSFPAGFVELNESAEQAAIREAKEEVGIDVRVVKLLNVFSRPREGIILIVSVDGNFRDQVVQR